MIEIKEQELAKKKLIDKNLAFLKEHFGETIQNEELIKMAENLKQDFSQLYTETQEEFPNLKENFAENQPIFKKASLVPIDKYIKTRQEIPYSLFLKFEKKEHKISQIKEIGKMIPDMSYPEAEKKGFLPLKKMVALGAVVSSFPRGNANPQEQIPAEESPKQPEGLGASTKISLNNQGAKNWELPKKMQAKDLHTAGGTGDFVKDNQIDTPQPSQSSPGIRASWQKGSMGSVGKWGAIFAGAGGSLAWLGASLGGETQKVDSTSFPVSSPNVVMLDHLPHLHHLAHLPILEIFGLC